MEKATFERQGFRLALTAHKNNTPSIEYEITFPTSRPPVTGTITKDYGLEVFSLFPQNVKSSLIGCIKDFARKVGVI